MFLFDVRASDTLYNQEKIMHSAKTICIYGEGDVKFLDNSFFIRKNLLILSYCGCWLEMTWYFRLGIDGRDKLSQKWSFNLA